MGHGRVSTEGDKDRRMSTKQNRQSGCKRPRMQHRKEEAQINILPTSLRNICQLEVIPMHTLLQDKQVGSDSSGTILLEKISFYFCK